MRDLNCSLECQQRWDILVPCEREGLAGEHVWTECEKGVRFAYYHSMHTTRTYLDLVTSLVTPQKKKRLNYLIVVCR